MFSITDKDGTIFSADSVEKTVELYRAFHSECNDDGWITWNGGECPVGLVYSGSKVDVRLRSGVIIAGDNPEFCYWYHDNAPSDIVAYKVVK